MKMKNEGFDQLAFARRVRRAGPPIHIPEDDGDRQYIPSNEIRIHQSKEGLDNQAYDTGYRNKTEILLRVTITSQTPRLAISCFGLRLPWAQTFFEWLEDPRQAVNPSHVYRFGNRGLEYMRDEVLNHHADVTKTLSAGQTIEGFLMGVAHEPIPQNFRHGVMIPAFLSVFDQYDREFEVPVSLQANRVTRVGRPKRSEISRRGGLLDKRDVVPR